MQTHPQPQKSRTLLAFCFIFSAVIVLDQATKFWAEKSFLLFSSPNEILQYSAKSLPIFRIGTEHWLDFSMTYVRNTGAAWGLMGNLPENIRPYFFYIITAVAMLFVVYLFVKTEPEKKLSRMAILLILAGATGNYIDRLWLHYVIDWIHFSWKLPFWQYDYPVFNIADSAVTCGVILLILDSFFQPKQQDK